MLFQDTNESLFLALFARKDFMQPIAWILSLGGQRGDRRSFSETARYPNISWIFSSKITVIHIVLILNKKLKKYGKAKRMCG